MDKLISNDLIKTLNGISGTAKDGLIEFHNQSMTQQLCAILGVNEIGLHTVTDEEVHPTEYIILNDFPVAPATITLKDEYDAAITGYTYELKNYPNSANRTVEIKDSAGNDAFLPYDEVYASYTAGYILKDKVEIENYANMTGVTMSVTNLACNTVTTYTFGTGISIGSSNATCAANAASAIGGTVSGDIFYAPLDCLLSLSTSTAYTYTAANLPYAFKSAMALLVAQAIDEKNRTDNVQQYSIGSKSVTFKSATDYVSFKNLISSYLGRFKKGDLKII